MEKFEKQNLSISVSIYKWSEKELIPIRIASKSKVYNRCNHKEGNCQPHKLIRLLLITKDDPETEEPSQHYSDAETFSTLIEKNQGSKMIAIQEHKVISFDYIIRRSNSKTKAPVKIRGDNPAGEFIKAMEKEVEQCQDFLTEGYIIQNFAKKLIKMLQSGIILEEIAEDYITSINIFQSWKLNKINLNFSKKYKKLIYLKHYLKGLYQAHKRDPLGVDIGIMYRLANTIYLSREKISAIPHNMESYLILNIENQRYMDSLQLIPESLDSHISNLGAKPCKEEVDKDGNSLNLPYRFFAYPERFPITREHGLKGRDEL
ncbi:39596_t:CDS:2, partial [Gigaspora margarita]